jgi:hypothetical protein
LSNKEPLKANDAVEVVSDNRQWLNGLQGKIIEITGDRARVKLDEPVDYSREAVFLLENLVKVEKQ